MKKMLALWLCVWMTLSLTACGRQESRERGDVGESAIEDITRETDAEPEPAPTDGSREPVEETEQENGKTLVAYFSVPENVETSGVDAVAGASIVVKDGEKLGNTEYVAGLTARTVGGDLFRIETVEEYPLDHDPLVDQAAEEQDEEKRPMLKNHVENFEQYDTVILGYPNWWADLPMPVYTFLEEYDFSGKTIVPFVTHGGSSFSGTVRTIERLQPNANVSDNTLSLSRNNVAGSEEEVIEWANSLGLSTETAE